jgi:hypothetical protein
VVTLGVPPPALDPVLFGDYQQLKRFFYLFLFRDSLAWAVEMVAADGMAFLDRLWQDWSPGYDAAEDLARAKESLRQPANLTAAISYYHDSWVTGLATCLVVQHNSAPGEGLGVHEVQDNVSVRPPKVAFT